jgi:DNA-binding NarL/FixJ family response regulator
MDNKIVIIEDDIEFAILQRQVINYIKGYSCQYVFENPIEFLRSNTVPDIVLLDILMPGINGLDYISVILDKHPQCSILINSIVEDEDQIFQAIKLGVVGYIDKQNFIKYIEDVLNSVANEGAYMTPRIAKKIFDYYNQKNTKIGKLTPREKDIVQGILDGMPYKLIAYKFGISIDTVRMNIRHVYKKFNVNSKTELINKIFGPNKI